MWLTGVRVLDFTRLLAGAYATLWLAHLGAEVVKVEPWPHGDPARRYFPDIFRATNWGKRSVAIDYRQPEGREACLRLVDRADVVVENFRPRLATALGLEGRVLRSRNPRLIHCSISGFGSRGLYRDRPAHNLTCLAFGGGLGAPEAHPSPPTAPFIPIADIGASLAALVGIVVALWRRERTGEGALIHTSLLETVMAMSAVRHGAFRGASLPHHEAPANRVYATRDGFLALSALEDGFWRALADVLGHPEWAEGDLATYEGRLTRREELAERLAAVLASGTSSAWADALWAAGVPAAPVRDLETALADSHIAELGMAKRVEGGLQVGIPLEMDGLRPWATSLPPALGAHTAEFLTEAGYGERAVSEAFAHGWAGVPSNPC